MFHINRQLDYDMAIGPDHRETWGSSQLYPAIVRIHTEMPPQDVPLHWHLGMELIYVRHGDVTLFIDGTETTIHDGQLCLVGPKALHSIHPTPRDGAQNVLSVSFDGEYLSRLCPDLAGVHINQGAVYGFGGIADGELLGLCERLALCVDGGEPALQMIELNALLYQLLMHLCTRCTVDAHTPEPPASQQTGMLRNITEYLERHYMEKLTIGEAASHFGYSREYFSRLFKHGTGVTPDRYLTEIRLQSALDDLMNSDDTVAMIAERNGFANVKSFSTAFQKRFSATPAAFRREHRAQTFPQKTPSKQSD